MTADFAAKLRGLDSKNSQGELSIEKFLNKSEEAFFDKVEEDKRDNAASLRSQRDSFYHYRVSSRRDLIVSAFSVNNYLVLKFHFSSVVW